MFDFSLFLIDNGMTLEERVERAKVLLAEKQAKKNEEQSEVSHVLICFD